jgi:YVTN family beta-propeller protein
VPVEAEAYGVAVTPDGKRVYVANQGNWPNIRNTVSVIDTATNTVTATGPVGAGPYGVVVTPDGENVYVVNGGEPAGYNSMGESYYAPSIVSVINTTTNKVTTYVTVRHQPVAFGQFIGGNIQKAKLNGTKAKASLSKHKQKKPLQTP